MRHGQPRGLTCSLFTRAAVYVSIDFVFFVEGLPIPPNHTHFFPTEASILDRHAEQRVFVLLVVSGKGVLVKQDEFRVFRDAFANSGSFFLIVAIRLDSRCMHWSLVVML